MAWRKLCNSVDSSRLRTGRSKGGPMRQKCCISQAGQAVVEFTLGFLLFLMVFYAIVEFAHLFYTRVNLNHALSEAGRYMITGQGIDASGSDPEARLTMIKQKFCRNLIATGLSCTDIDTHFEVTCIGGCTQPAGGPGQTVTLTATFQKSWFTGLFDSLMGGPVTLTTSTTWKNEPFLTT